MQYHESVLLRESIDGLAIREDGVYVDVTFGGGGHSRSILKKLTSGRLVAFDRDADAEVNVQEDGRLTLVRQNFRFLQNYLKLYGALPIHGLLADLGVSSHQFDTASRGFSFRSDAELDMRMDRDQQLSGIQVVNEYSVDELRRIFREYGELKGVGKLVDYIDRMRSRAVLRTTFDLVEALKPITPVRNGMQWLAQVFQAIRIEVNDELGALKDLLKQATQCLAPQGRLVVISYHSLEDRLVKHWFRAGNFEGEQEQDFYGNIQRPLDPVNGKVIIPTAEEIAANPRARSAKLRIATKR